MYVQPLYAKRSGTDSSFPILRFVLVSYGSRSASATRCAGPSPTSSGVTNDPRGADRRLHRRLDGGSSDGGGQRPRRRQPDGSGPVNDQIRSLLDQAEAKFDAADRAQANGNTVGWARLMDQGRELITQAVELADQRDAG